MNQMIFFLKEKEKTISYLIFLLFSLSINLLNFFKGHYYIVDDAIMNNIVSGGYSVKPDEHVVFVNVIIGKVCKWLYLTTNSINWYGALNVLLIVVCVAVLFTIMRRHINVWISIAIVLLIEIHMSCYLSFTTLGFMCTTVGIIGLIDVLLDNTYKYRRIVAISCIFLLLNGQMFRETSWLVTIVIVSPLACLILKKNIIARKRVIIIILGIIICSIGVHFINSFSYSTKKYSIFQSYNEARAKIFDYPIANYEQEEKAYNKLNVSQNDYHCIKTNNNRSNFLIGDKDFFSERRLNQIANIPHEKYNLDILNWIKQLLGEKKIILILFLGLFFFISDSGKRKYYYLIQFSIVFSLIFYLFMIQRNPLRVQFNMLLVGLLCSFYFYFISNNERKFFKSVLVSVEVGCLIYVGLICKDTIKTNIEYSKINEDSEIVRQYFDTNKDKLFIMPTYGFNSVFYYYSIKDSGMIKNKNVLPVFDWNSYMDDYYYKVDKYQISNKNSLLLSMTDENVYYVFKKTKEYDEVENRNIIKRYIEKHRKKKIKINTVERIKNTSYIVFKYSIDE